MLSIKRENGMETTEFNTFGVWCFIPKEMWVHMYVDTDKIRKTNILGTEQ